MALAGRLLAIFRFRVPSFVATPHQSFEIALPDRLQTGIFESAYGDNTTAPRLLSRLLAVRVMMGADARDDPRIRAAEKSRDFPERGAALRHRGDNDVTEGLCAEGLDSSFPPVSVRGSDPRRGFFSLGVVGRFAGRPTHPSAHAVAPLEGQNGAVAS
jgi:hypothetical protein